MPTIKLALGSQEKSFDVAQQGDVINVTHEGKTVALRLVQQDGALAVFAYTDDNGHERRLRVAVQPSGEKRQGWINGRYHTYQRLRQRASHGNTNSGSLAASIPAIVREILVQPGDTVAAGDKLILLESMKMVIPIQAPHDGTVTQIHCQPGDAVQPGVSLIELDQT
ncbi:MAG: hypothetical protein KDE56_21970 [Anaerolineales bacterium]|nr:hypothetical protein [Anaerolineales bacterium]